MNDSELERAMVDEWISVETLPPLGEDEVQLWRVDLPDESTPPERYDRVLSLEERKRSARLRAGRVRLQFVVARAVLRTLLGHCLSLDPNDVSISQTSFGKPETPGMFFNVAHSGAAILIALCRSRPLGTDVECVSRSVEAVEIAKHSFTAAEYAALSSIADKDEQRNAFFRLWTRKEAVIKADGRGLSVPLDSFELPIEDPLTKQSVISLIVDAAVVRYWVCDVNYSEEAVAACAMAAPFSKVSGFIFPLGLVTDAVLSPGGS